MAKLTPGLIALVVIMVIVVLVAIIVPPLLLARGDYLISTPPDGVNYCIVDMDYIKESPSFIAAHPNLKDVTLKWAQMIPCDGKGYDPSQVLDLFDVKKNKIPTWSYDSTSKKLGLFSLSGSKLFLTWNPGEYSTVEATTPANAANQVIEMNADGTIYFKASNSPQIVGMKPVLANRTTYGEVGASTGPPIASNPAENKITNFRLSKTLPV